MNKIEKWSFFQSYAGVIERLRTEDDKKEFIWAIYNYVYHNIKPQFTNRDIELKEIGWEGIVANLDASKNRSNNAKKKNKT